MKKRMFAAFLALAMLLPLIGAQALAAAGDLEVITTNETVADGTSEIYYDIPGGAASGETVTIILKGKSQTALRGFLCKDGSSTCEDPGGNYSFADAGEINVAVEFKVTGETTQFVFKGQDWAAINGFVIDSLAIFRGTKAEYEASQGGGEPTETPTQTPESDGKDDAPQTGDSGSIVMASLMMFGAAMGMVVIAKKRREMQA